MQIYQKKKNVGKKKCKLFLFFLLPLFFFFFFTYHKKREKFGMFVSFFIPNGLELEKVDE